MQKKIYPKVNEMYWVNMHEKLFSIYVNIMLWVVANIGKHLTTMVSMCFDNYLIDLLNYS